MCHRKSFQGATTTARSKGARRCTSSQPPGAKWELGISLVQALLRLWLKLPLPSVSGIPVSYLKGLLPEVLRAQHSKSSCADESRPLTQYGGLRFTVSHQGYRAAIHTDCHTVPPAGQKGSVGGASHPTLPWTPHPPYPYLPSMRLTCCGGLLNGPPRRCRAGPSTRPSCRAPLSS